MKVETTVTLDLSGDPVTQTVTAKQGDIDSRLVRCTPVFAGENYLPEERVTIRLLYRNAHGDCTICDGQMEAGQVLVPLIPSLLAYAGTARCEVQFYSDGAVLTTGWFQVEVYPCLIRQEEAEENPAYESFTAALARADAAAETCLAAGATAQAQGDYAEMQAEYARQSGDSADEMAGYAREQGNAAMEAAAAAQAQGEAAAAASSAAGEAALRAEKAAEAIEGTDVGALAGEVAAVKSQLTGKVDRVEGKGLSTCDYTAAEKEKLATLANYDDSALRTLIGQKVDREAGKQLSSNDYTDADRQQVSLIAGKVDQVSGMGLSSNDYTTAEKEKLASLSNYNDAGLRSRITNLEDQACVEYELELNRGFSGSLFLYRFGNLCILTGVLYEVGQVVNETVAQLPGDCLPPEEMMRIGLWTLGEETNVNEGYISLLSADCFNIIKVNSEPRSLFIQVIYRRAA